MNYQKASIGLRFLAMCIDNFIISIITVPFFMFMDTFALTMTPFISFLYYGLLEGCTGATLGKKICGITVLDKNGNRICASLGFTRSLCRFLSQAIFGIGFLVALFNEDGASLHDKLAGTFVASTQAAGAPATPSQAPYGTPKIVGLSGFYAGRSFPIPREGLIIGREQRLCGLTFPQDTPGVSKTHCKIEYNYTTRMFILQDLGSSHGTFTKENTRVSGQPIALDSGSEFYLASPQVLFRVEI